MHLHFVAGANLRTGKIGIFPLAHVVDVEYNDFDPNGVSSERKERYLLEYIGSVESHLYKGNAVLCQAVKKIVGAKMAPKRHACVIEISDKGIKMIDKSRLNVSDPGWNDRLIDGQISLDGPSLSNREHVWS